MFKFRKKIIMRIVKEYAWQLNCTQIQAQCTRVVIVTISLSFSRYRSYSGAGKSTLMSALAYRNQGE